MLWQLKSNVFISQVIKLIDINHGLKFDLRNQSKFCSAHRWSNPGRKLLVQIFRGTYLFHSQFLWILPQPLLHDLRCSIWVDLEIDCKIYHTMIIFILIFIQYSPFPNESYQIQLPPLSPWQASFPFSPAQIIEFIVVNE